MENAVRTTSKSGRRWFNSSHLPCVDVAQLVEYLTPLSVRSLSPYFQIDNSWQTNLNTLKKYVYFQKEY